MRGDNILLLFSKHLNKWHLPGGHIQVGETFESGLSREVEEETGCKLKFFHRIRSTNNNVALYIGRLQPGIIKLSDEHAKYIWVPINKSLNLNVCKFTYRDIRYLQTIMNTVRKAVAVEEPETTDN
jgi:8-oxo-dGTP pyrophosphatase MutT (NUDIX family)